MINDNKFDHLIPEIENKIINHFMTALSEYPEIANDMMLEIYPLLNLTISVFRDTLYKNLSVIQRSTDGEYRLINNIKIALIKCIEDLPFVKNVEII